LKSVDHALPNHLSHGRPDLRIRTNLPHRNFDFADEILGCRYRAAEVVTNMFLEFLVGLFEKAVWLGGADDGRAGRAVIPGASAHFHLSP
jgi:hypothetical protein